MVDTIHHNSCVLCSHCQWTGVSHESLHIFNIWCCYSYKTTECWL